MNACFRGRDTIPYGDVTSRVLLTVITRPALALAIVVLGAWLVHPAPWLLRAIPIALAILSFGRPALGLGVLAALGPLTGALSAYTGSPEPSAAFLEQLMLATIVGANLRLLRQRDSAGLSAIATLLGVIAAASAIATQPVLLLRDSPGVPLLDHINSLLRGAYFTPEPTWHPLRAAALIVEGLALAVTAERVLRRSPASTGSVLLMFVIATTAVAMLNLTRLVEGAARTGDVMRAIPGLFLHVRISRYYDVNAAGTVFLMVLLTAMGLTSQVRRPALWIVIVILLLGIWVSGSRTALAVLVIALIGALAFAAVAARGARRWMAGSALALLIAGAAAATVLYPAGRNAEPSDAYATRRVMAHTGLAMWRSAPIFGVGVGRFQAESSRFGATALRDELHFSLVNENAHNNFLQVLAELGLTGLGALLVLIGTVVIGALRAERQAPIRMRRWLTLGLVAGLLTWLTGHPQLVPDAAFAFWLLVGVLASLLAPPGSVAAGRPAQVAAAILTTAVIASVPFRTRAAIAAADLEHVGTGVSVWHPDAAIGRYRDAGRAFALYLPADGSTVVLPVRRANGTAESLRLSISARGQLLKEVVIAGEDWHRIPIALRPAGRRFELVHFTVSGVEHATPEGPLLNVGRAEPQ